MKFGLVGLGAIGAIRAAALGKNATCSLVGVFDADVAKASAVTPGTRAFESLDAMLADDVIDAVIISTPPNTHEEFAIRAMTAGKHVLIEKPLAPTVEACARIIETSRKTGKIATAGYNHRYFPAAKLVRDIVLSGAIGKLSHVRGFTGHMGLQEFKAKWMYDADVMGGGALMDNGTHMVDLVRYIMGDAEEIFSMSSNAIWQLPQVEDYAMVSMRSNEGVIGTIEASWDEWRGYRFHIDAYGDKGMARAYYAPMSATVVTMDKPGGTRRVVHHRYLKNIFAEKLKGWQSTAIQTLDEEITDFAALAGGQPTGGRIATAIDGFRAVEISHASYRSSASGQSQRLTPLASI